MPISAFGTRLALVATVVGPLVSCQSMGHHQGIADAHRLYQRGDYAGAAKLYEEAVAGDADLTVAYFYLGNSYDQLYRPALRGEADNDRLLELAVANYSTAVDRETDAAMRTLATQMIPVPMSILSSW